MTIGALDEAPETVKLICPVNTSPLLKYILLEEVSVNVFNWVIVLIGVV